MTRMSLLVVALTVLGGDQRDRDREKAQKKAAGSGKSKSSSAKEKESYAVLSYNN